MSRQTSIAWSISYECGIKTVDDEHRQLIELARLLHVAVIRKAGDVAIEQTLNALALYAHVHFRGEEAALAERGDGSLEEHRRLHAELTKEVELLALDRMLAFDSDFAERLVDWVNNRLVRHIIEADGNSFRQLAKRSAARKPGAPADGSPAVALAAS